MAVTQSHASLTIVYTALGVRGSGCRTVPICSKNGKRSSNNGKGQTHIAIASYAKSWSSRKRYSKAKSAFFLCRANGQRAVVGEQRRVSNKHATYPTMHWSAQNAFDARV